MNPFRSLMTLPLVFVFLLATSAEIASPQNPQRLNQIRERILEEHGQSEYLNNLKMSLLSGIAFYPDEVIAAIFEVAQEPQSLATGALSENPEFNEALKILSVHPEILQKMVDHPGAVRIIGEMAENNLAQTWKLIDDLRARYREEAGVSVAEAVVSEATPPLVSVDSAGQDGNTEDDVTVDLSGVESIYVEDPNDPEMVYVYPTTAVAYPVATTGYYVTGNAAVSGGGYVVTEDGNVYAAKGGAAVVETQNGTVAVGGVGHAQADAENGEYSTGATFGAINEDGEGVIAHREAEGSWDENSASRSVDGNVQTTTGQGVEYDKDQSIEKTEDGFTRERSASIETNSGQTAEYESSSTVSKGEDGVEVDRGGSATGPSGESVAWGNQDAAKTKEPATSTRGQQIQNFSGKAGQANRSYRKPNQQTWDRFSSTSKSSPSSSEGSKYRRSGDSAKSLEAFSAKSLNSQDLGTAIDRAMKQQQIAFDSFEHKTGGFQGPKSSQRKQGTGFQGPNHSGRSSGSGFKGQSAGLQGRGGGGRRR